MVSDTVPPNSSLIHSSFYRFVRLADPQRVLERLKQLTQGMSGSILLASEGINGMVAGTASQLQAFETALQSEFDGVMAGTVFKHSECQTVPFKHMRVKLKREIVALGLEGVDAIGRPRKALSPEQWRELLERDDVVVIDNRNSFEFKLGRFKGAIDPGVLHFRDFPAWVEDHMPEWRQAGKKVAMYCTGGIRCEKTSAWLLDRGLEVYELDGGILNYFLKMPDAEREWQGECFVFDNRVAIDTHLKETDTPVEAVYKDEPDGQWRINRARRLAAS